MFAPPGVDSDDSSGGSGEDITPPPSPKVRARPSFSFKSLFTPTKRLAKRPSVKQQVNEAEEIKHLTPVQAANFLPPTPPKGKKRVRIHLDGEEEAQGKDSREPVAQLPFPSSTSLPYLVQHTEGNEERSQAADEVLTLLRQLVADQAVAEKQGINPNHSKLSTIHPFPSPPIPIEEPADARLPRRSDEQGSKTDKNEKLTPDKVKQPTIRPAEERPKRTNLTNNERDRTHNIDPSDPNLPPEGHHLNESYYQSFIPFPEPRLIPQSASQMPYSTKDHSEPRGSSGPSQDEMGVPAFHPPPQNLVPGPAWHTGRPDPLYPSIVRPPYQGPQGPPHTYDSDYSHHPGQHFYRSYAPQQPNLPQPPATTYQTSQQDWSPPPPISATGYDCQPGMPSSHEQRAYSGYAGAPYQHLQTPQYPPAQQYPQHPPYSAPPQGYIPQPPHPPPFYPHPAVLLPYNPYYSTHPLHLPQPLPQPQPNYYPTNTQFQATLPPPIHSAPLLPTDHFSSPLANPWPGSSSDGSSPTNPPGLEADGLILKPSPATPLATRSHNVHGVGGSVKGIIGSRFSLSRRHGKDDPNVKSMSESDDPEMGEQEKSEKEAILQVHERRVWDHFRAKGLKGAALEEAVYKTLSKTASPRPEWRSEREAMDSMRPTDGNLASREKSSEVSGTTRASGLATIEQAEKVQKQPASDPVAGTRPQPVGNEIQDPTKSAREEKLRSHYASKGLTGEMLDKAVSRAMTKEGRSLPSSGRIATSGEALRPAEEKVVHRNRQEISGEDSYAKKHTKEELPPMTLRGKQAVRDPKEGGSKEVATTAISQDPAPEAGPSILPNRPSRIAGLVDEVVEQKEKLKLYYAKKGLKGEELDRMVKKALDKSAKSKAKTTSSSTDTSKHLKRSTDVNLPRGAPKTIAKADARELTEDRTARINALDLQKEKMNEHHAAEGLRGFELGKAVAKSMANDTPEPPTAGTEMVLNDVGPSKSKATKKSQNTSEQEVSYPKPGPSRTGTSDMEEAKLRARYASKGYTPGQIDRILSKLSGPSSNSSARPQGETVYESGQAEKAKRDDAKRDRGRNKGQNKEDIGKDKEAEIREAVEKLSIPGRNKGDPKDDRDLKGKREGKPREDGESIPRGDSEGRRRGEIVDEGIMLEVEKEMMEEAQSKDNTVMSQRSGADLRPAMQSKGTTPRTKNLAEIHTPDVGKFVPARLDLVASETPERVRTIPIQDGPPFNDIAVSAARIAHKTEEYTLAHPHGPFLEPQDPLSQGGPHAEEALPVVVGEHSSDQPVAGYSVAPEPQTEDITWSKTLVSLASCIDLAHTLLPSLSSGHSNPGTDDQVPSTNTLSEVLPKLIASLLVQRDMMETMRSIFGDDHSAALGEFVKHLGVVKQYLTAQLKSKSKSISGNNEKDRDLMSGLNNGMTHSFLEVTLQAFLSHSLGMDDVATRRIVGVLIDLVQDWREGIISGTHIVRTISMLRNELEDIPKRHSTDVKAVETTQSKAHGVLRLLEQLFGLVQFDHPQAEATTLRAPHPASEVSHLEGSASIPPVSTVGHENVARSVERHSKDESAKRRHKFGLENFEGKVHELEHKSEDKFRGSSPLSVDEIASSTNPSTLTIDLSPDMPAMPFHLKREAVHKEPKLPARKARDTSTTRPRHVRKAPAPPGATLQKTPPPKLNLPPTTHAFLSDTTPPHEHARAHEHITPLYNHEPIESIITFPPGPAIGSHPALEGVHLERHRPSWSSDSHYSDEVESEGTVESDEEARELLANANSGPRMEMPVNKYKKEKEEEPSKEMVEEAKEILRSNPRKVKTKVVTNAKA